MRKLTLFALITLLADFGLRAQNSSPSEEALLGGSLDAPIRIDLFSDSSALSAAISTWKRSGLS